MKALVVSTMQQQMIVQVFTAQSGKKTKNKNFFEKFVVFDIGIKLEKKLNIIGKL